MHAESNLYSYKKSMPREKNLIGKRQPRCAQRPQCQRNGHQPWPLAVRVPFLRPAEPGDRFPALSNERLSGRNYLSRMETALPEDPRDHHICKVSAIAISSDRPAPFL